ARALVVAVGAPAFPYPPEGFGPFLPAGPRLFQLIDDPDAASWLPTGTSIVTSQQLGIADLLDRPAPRRRPRPEGRRKPARAKAGRTITVEYLIHSPAPIRPPPTTILPPPPTR